MRELYRQQFLLRALNRRIGEFQAQHSSHHHSHQPRGQTRAAGIAQNGPEGSVELQQVDQWSHNNSLHHFNPLQAKVG